MQASGRKEDVSPSLLSSMQVSRVAFNLNVCNGGTYIAMNFSYGL